MTTYLNKLKDFDKHVLFEFKEKNIITDLYQYYFYNGFHNIITEKIIRLLISYLLIFIINLVINCIDYSRILTITTTQTPIKFINTQHYYIYDFIDLNNWFPTNPYLIICFLLYCIYLFCITINCIGTIKKFWKIRTIYNKYLNLNDYRLKFITWDEIILQITKRLKPDDILDTTNINIYTINNKICQQSNIIIALLRNNFISLPNLSKFLEWNFIFCIIDPMTYIKKTPTEIIHQQTYINTQSTETNLDSIINNICNTGNKQIYGNYTEPLIMINDNNNQYISYIDKQMSSINTQSTETNLDSIINNLSNTGNKQIYGNYTEPLIMINDNNNQHISYIDKQTSSIKFDNKFDNTLYNTFINQPICNTEIAEYTEYIKKVHYRINLALVINIIAMPFTILILFVYLIIKYGEKMYVNPSILFQRQLNIKVRWQLRYYNELPNLFKDRLLRIERNMDKIINSYYSPTSQIIYRFLIFAIGSIFIILLVLSFIANEGFSQLQIIAGHNIIWFLGISGTLLIILNKCIFIDEHKLTKTEQINAFEELREDLVSINPHILKIEDREYLVNLIQKIYHSRIKHIAYEIWYLFASPYYLWQWKRNIGIHCNQILELLDNHYILGNVCKYSIFSNLQDMQNNPHMLLSLKEFYYNHNWKLSNFTNYDFTMKNSILLQSQIFN